MKQSLRGGHCHQRADLSAPARLSEHRDIARIAAEIGDVVANPFQHRDDIEHAGITRSGVLLPSRLGEIQVAKHVETVVAGNHDNVSALRQIMPVIGKQSSA